MMNQNKKSNGWILCPSNSFPGKFYYFNVVNGEAAWSLENQNLKRDYGIHKIADKSHSFPEPSGPPLDHTPNISISNNSFKKPIYSTIPKRVIDNTQAPMFGQAIFPNYAEPYLQNIVWAPIQLPPQMYFTNTPDMGMKMPIDRIGQCSRNPYQNLFVQTCDLSLSKRFEMYAKQQTFEDKFLFNKFYEASTPIKDSFDGKVMNNSQMFSSIENASYQKPKEIKAKYFIREPDLKRVRTQSDPEELNNINKANSVESLHITENSAIMKTTLSGNNKVKNCSNNAKGDLCNLDDDDLRLRLVAKRQKSMDLGDLGRSSEGKKIKTTKDEVRKAPPKKRVTFDLGDQNSSYSVDDQMKENIKNPDEEISPYIENVPLYVAVDLDTLLDEYEFIEEYIQSDDNLKLLIPHELQAEIEAVCLGDCRGRQRVIAARQITRKLVSPPSYYVLLPQFVESPNSVQYLIFDNRADNYILNTLLQIVSAGDQVMLITNNTALYNEAKTLNIDCFTTKELKDGELKDGAKPEVSFVLKRSQIDVSRHHTGTNVILQPPSDYIIKNKEEIPENKFKIRTLYDIFKEQNKNKFKDANTSPIDARLFDVQSDKLIDITRKKKPSMPEIGNSFKTPTTEIGLNMQNLFINEKQNVRFENGSFEKRKESIQKGTEQDSLDSLLSAYSVKNKEMEENIKVRLDEWICCFTQLIETALIEVIVKHCPITDKLSPPWVLYESVRRIQELYGSHTKVNVVIKKFEELLLNNSSKIGKLKSFILPNDFVKIVGCGIILVETLKTIEPSISLEEASKSLVILLENMAQPSTDIPTITTPVLTRGDNVTAIEERPNYIKKPSEIIEYLKTHFLDWKNFETPPDCEIDKPKVVRTFGRDLNLLEIDKNKSITLKTRTSNIINDNPLKKAHKSAKIDGIDAINREILPKPNAKFDNGNTKISTIVFQKFDRSFICEIGNEKNKPTSTVTNLNDEEKININNKNGKQDCEISKTAVNKDKVPNTKPNNNKNEPKIIRPFANLFQQNNIEKVKTTNVDDLNIPKHGNTFNSTETAGPKVIRTFNNIFLPKLNDKSIATPIIDDLNVPTHGNTFNQENETAERKVIRNIKQIETFEKKLKENPTTLDLDALDYSEMDRSLSSTEILDETSIQDNVSFVYKIKKPSITLSNDKNITEVNDNALENHNYYSQTNINEDSAFNNDNANDSATNNNSLPFNNDIDDSLPMKDDTNDSGIENESIHAYSLIKIFLAELSESVKSINTFIVKSVQVFYEDDNYEEKKRMLHEKANKTHLIIAGIIDNLKSIIQRESNEGTSVRSMLLKAGEQAASDKRMTRYRQVVTKCLEQAQILENALKTVLALSDDPDANASINSSDHSGFRYYNIFE